MNICEYGCNNEAKYKLKNNKWCCKEWHSKCPSMKFKFNSVSIHKTQCDKCKEFIPNCSFKIHNEKCKSIKYCKFCQIELLNKNNKFCSRSCAAKYNNKIKPKRKLLEKSCKKCNKKLVRNNYLDTNLLCNKCYKNTFYNYDKITIKELQTKRDLWGIKNMTLRQLSRKIYLKSDKPKYCINCGYNKMFDVCHIKAIKNFSDDTLVSEVNDINNLIALCKNCHWECDNDKISKENILKKCK